MNEFGFPPLEVEQATMVMADAADLEKCEERIIKRLKGKGMFGEVPFMQLSAPFYLSFTEFQDSDNAVLYAAAISNNVD